MKRSDFISNRKVEIPKLDEKVIGTMILQALIKADVNIDDTIENREILQKCIDKIITAPWSNPKESAPEDGTNGINIPQRLRDILSTTPGTSTGLFPMTSDRTSPTNITYGGTLYGMDALRNSFGDPTTTATGPIAISTTSSTGGSGGAGYATSEQAGPSASSYFAGIDPAQSASSYFANIQTDDTNSIRSALASRSSLSTGTIAAALGIGNAAV
jgi:hypothetical protein